MTALFFISSILVAANMIALAYRDLKDYILPNILNLNLVLLFLAFHLSSNWTFISPFNSLFGGVLGGGFLLLVRTIANRFYKQDSLGLGDVKMITAAGFGLGFPDIFIALSLGSCLGVLHGAFISYKNKIPLAEVQVPAGFGLTIGILTITLLRIISLQ